MVRIISEVAKYLIIFVYGEVFYSVKAMQPC